MCLHFKFTKIFFTGNSAILSAFQLAIFKRSQNGDDAMCDLFKGRLLINLPAIIVKGLRE
jgi:hypothetical protein